MSSQIKSILNLFTKNTLLLFHDEELPLVYPSLNPLQKFKCHFRRDKRNSALSSALHGNLTPSPRLCDMMLCRNHYTSHHCRFFRKYSDFKGRSKQKKVTSQ